jgi:hypothetical protein
MRRGWEERFRIVSGSPVILYLQSPKEKVWGFLLGLTEAGVVVRGIDLASFDDWLRQESRREERTLGLNTVFFPIGRVEKMERDETVGPMEGYADRFAREVGKTAREVVLSAEPAPPGGRRR